MLRQLLLTFLMLLGLGLLAACDDAPPPQPVVLNFWRPISNPNVYLTDSQASEKLNYDLAQCRCGSYPINVPHQEIGVIARDQARLHETSATRMDAGMGCSTSPDAVLIECMRMRGWEPTACSGRMRTNGSTQCATSLGYLNDYPEEYPYRGPLDNTWGNGVNSPAEMRQRYP